MENDVAIKVSGVSKTFRIPHEKISSLRGAAVSVFSKKRGYEEFKALDDVSFEVKKGEFFGIIGRNGSGKSTLLKILAGIYQPDKGKVKVNGRISPFLELGIGFNPELSGRDNIYLNATVLGLSKKEIDEKFDSIVKFSELERFIDQKLKNYSSGMQVRLAFSVSIHANREILLMDEVLAVGDSNFQQKCLDEFNKYKENGKTVILVTHDIRTIEKYCDRALLLKEGTILDIGEAYDVSRRYLQENIKDEKERLEGHVKSEKKEILKDFEIKEVWIEDEYFNKTSVFKTLDKVRILIKYDIKKPLKNPIFGLILKDSFHKMPIFANNTQISKKDVSNVEKGEFIIRFDFLNGFNNGSYDISAYVLNANEQVIFETKSIGKIEVMNTQMISTGMVHFENDISIVDNMENDKHF